jgi:ferredoxin-NADP reductase
MATTALTAQPDRLIHLFYGVRNSADHPFKQTLEQLASQHENLHLHLFYSEPLHNDIIGQDYESAGRVTLDHLRNMLPSNNFNFYLCGPAPFMESLVNALKDWDVPKSCIHSESFGASTVKKVGKNVSDKPGQGSQEETGVQPCI